MFLSNPATKTGGVFLFWACFDIVNAMTNYFKGKKITVMGLGLLGRGVGDTQFLAECGADIVVTDLKSRKELTYSLKKLKRFKNIRYTFGKHILKDFKNRDLIIKAAGVPLNSSFVREAHKNKIPVEMSSSLFARLSGAKIIGITGTRGKSTVTHLVYEILKCAKKKVYLGGNVRGLANLPLLKKVKKTDYVVMELDSWQLQGFGESKMSPHIAVFTTFMEDHLNYYKESSKSPKTTGQAMSKYFSDKANIFRFQKEDDVLITSPKIVRYIVQNRLKFKLKNSIVYPVKIPADWKIPLLGKHNKENISLAVAVVDILKIPRTITKKVVENFKGVSGRMELIRTYKGVKIYNDTTATTPQATLAAFKALSRKKNIVLIMGGADKSIDMMELLKDIPKYCKALVLLPGTGTNRVFPQLQITSNKLHITPVNSLKEAVENALKCAQKGDIILLSPAFASFGPPPGGFKNEFDRGDEFVKLVKKLK